MFVSVLVSVCGKVHVRRRVYGDRERREWKPQHLYATTMVSVYYFPTPLHLSNRPFFRVRPLSFPKQAQPLIQWVTDELRGVRDSPSKGGNAVRVATVIDAALLSYYDGDRSHGFWETTGNEGDRATAIE